MALSFLAPKITLKPTPVEDGMLVYCGGDIKLSFSHQGDELHSRFIFRAREGGYNAGGRKAGSTPPVHYHRKQEEEYRINSGTMTYLLDGTQHTIGPGERVLIPAGHAHSFWNASESEDMDMTTVTVGKGFDETFERNWYGYLSSMLEAGREPNFLHTFAFAYNADVVVAMPLGLGVVVNYVLGYLVAQCLLGLKTEFKEFAKAE